MRSRKRFAGDSLDLLLDTVCSMFGAITLISILVALLARTSGSGDSTTETGDELLRRKIAMAESDLEATRRLSEKLRQTSKGASAEELSQLQQLAAAVEKAKMAREAAQIELASQVAAQNVDVSTEVRKLAAELAALERKQTEAANTNAALDQNTQRLNARVEAIGKQIADDMQKRKLTLRFPKERAKTKKTFPIICKYGKVYPVFGNNAKLNKESIAWQTVGISAISKPIPAEGWRPETDRAPIERSLQAVSNLEYYVTYFVYPDSVATFRVIRDWAIAAGFEVGFELEPADATISWGEEGTMPPPL